MVATLEIDWTGYDSCHEICIFKKNWYAMILFPNAKINLGLYITARRANGYHDIQSIFLPIGLSDILEVVPAAGHQHRNFTTTGIPIEDKTGKNLVLTALEHVRQDYDLPAVGIHLHKNIPPGSGLGGGSADAAFMVFALDRLFKLGMDEKKKRIYLGNLGSDCTFFLENSPCFVSGTGDQLAPLSLKSISHYWIGLVVPGVHISTKLAYSMVQPHSRKKALNETICAPVRTWKQTISNDFEIPVFKKYPILKDIKSLMYDQGAVYASLSGSGSSVYGFFQDPPVWNTAFQGMFVWTGRMAY